MHASHIAERGIWRLTTFFLVFNSNWAGDFAKSTPGSATAMVSLFVPLPLPTSGPLLSWSRWKPNCFLFCRSAINFATVISQQAMQACHWWVSSCTINWPCAIQGVVPMSPWCFCFTLSLFLRVNGCRKCVLKLELRSCVRVVILSYK